MLIIKMKRETHRIHTELAGYVAEGGEGSTAEFTLPMPCFNVINGGSHAGNKLAFQEYFVIPTGAEDFAEAMKIGTECYHHLKKILKGKFGGDATLIGDEGGFAPPCDARGGVELVVEAIEAAGYGGRCSIGMDVAASEFFDEATGTCECEQAGWVVGRRHSLRRVTLPCTLFSPVLPSQTT